MDKLDLQENLLREELRSELDLLARRARFPVRADAMDAVLTSYAEFRRLAEVIRSVPLEPWDEAADMPVLILSGGHEDDGR